MNGGNSMSKRKQIGTKVTITRSDKKLKTEMDEKNHIMMENQHMNNMENYSSEYFILSDYLESQVQVIAKKAIIMTSRVALII